ncbi:MAG: HIT family protein [Parachlamydiaceae bacterium]
MNPKLILFLLSCCLSFLFGEEGCPFCNPSIIQDQEVYRGQYWSILLDFKPVVKGHLLIVPIEHHVTRHEISREAHDELFEIEKKIHCVFQTRFGKDIEDFQYEKNGPTLQSVHHFHIHVLPINKNLKSTYAKVKLLTRLLILPPKKLSIEEKEKEKLLYIDRFKKC